MLCKIQFKALNANLIHLSILCFLLDRKWRIFDIVGSGVRVEKEEPSCSSSSVSHKNEITFNLDRCDGSNGFVANAFVLVLSWHIKLNTCYLYGMEQGYLCDMNSFSVLLR